jgi:S-adenosylmethionine/arginine decarboxylase-like enzyme
MADLYLCQKMVWDSPELFREQIEQSAAAVNITNLSWIADLKCHDHIRMSADFDDSFILFQIFPVKGFLTVDLFSWNPQIDFQSLSESIIDRFAPQVVATESHLRGEHLKE